MKAYGYIRVSTKDQADNGRMLNVYRAAAGRWYKAMLEDKGYEWGGIVEEEPVTASRPLVNRPKGKLLAPALERGDYVLFPKLDRGFRCTKDLLNTVDAWAARGVLVRFLDIDVDTGAASGRFYLTIMGAAAEFERARLCERIKLIHEWKRERGMLAQGNPPLGWKLKKERDGYMLIPCDEERGLALRCFEWFEQEWTLTQIRQHLLAQGVERTPHRQKGKGKKGNRWYGRSAIWSMIEAARYDFHRGGIRCLNKLRKEGRAS